MQLLERQGVCIQVETVRLQNILPGIFRGLMRGVLTVPLKSLNEKCLLIVSRLDTQPARRPDLIISSGGKSAFASLVLKRRYRAHNIFVGVPAPFPDRWFDLVVSPVERPFKSPYVVSGLIPNTVTRQKVLAAGKDYWKSEPPPTPCWTLLVGGDSKSHHYSLDDWSKLAEGINNLGQSLGIRWLITTSRRTPAEVETLLAEALDRNVVAELVLYNRSPKRVVQPFLAVSERVLVTQDSLTMASEALCSGSPVTLLAPEELEVPAESFFANMLQYFAQLDGVERIPMARLPSYRPTCMVDKSVMTLDQLGPELISALKAIGVPCDS